MHPIEIIVFTDFFKREKKLYALGDIALTRPISFKLAGNILLFLGLWTFPIVKIFGMGALISSPYVAIITLGPAIGMGFLVSKPNAIFNHKSFYTWILCNIKYALSPKYWCDMKSSTINNGDKVNGDFRVWIGDTWLDDYGNPLESKQIRKNSRVNKKSRRKNRSK